MREIDLIKCSCGRLAEEVEATDEEEKAYGCGTKGCCVKAIQCKCGVRFTIMLEAPEMQ